MRRRVRRATPERTNQRNGYRHRDLDTRVGTLDVAIPKLREGTLLPGLAARAPQAGRGGADHGGRRPATCSGSRPGGWTSWSSRSGSPACPSPRSRGWPRTSTSTSRDFRHPPAGRRGPYTFVAADALTMKVREGGRVVKVAVMVATGVNADGYREVLGIHTATTRDRGRLARASSATWSPAACPGSGWSPPTRTPAWSRRSGRPCPARPGNGAAPTTPRT